MECFKPVPICLNKLTHRYIYVRCGKCLACRDKDAKDWAIRLSEELRSSMGNAVAVTLTFNDDSLNEFGYELNYRPFQLFLKRLRKSCSPVKIRFFVVGEYGHNNSMRPHFHALLFGLHFDDESVKRIERAWSYGFVKCSRVSHSSIKYISSYFCYGLYFDDAPVGFRKPFRRMSTKPIIGCGFLTPQKIDFYRKSFSPFYVFDGGFKRFLPRAYSSRIFISDDDKSKASQEVMKIIKSYEDFIDDAVFYQKNGIPYKMFKATQFIDRIKKNYKQFKLHEK